MQYYCTKFRDLGLLASAAHSNRGIVFIQLYNSQFAKSTLTLFSTFDMSSQEKSADTAKKIALILVNLPSFKVTRLKLAKIHHRKSRNFEDYFMVGEQTCSPPYKGLENFATLRGYMSVSFQQITFKLGNFFKLKALFPEKLTDFLLLVQKKTWNQSILMAVNVQIPRICKKSYAVY